MDEHTHFKNARIGKIDKYWMMMDHRAATEPLNYKDISLPLARIKRLMKVEEDVKMVASEVPILFSKVTENFIEELTLRAWIHTDENKRRIIQRSDISAAIKTSDVYDFLIYIVPKSSLENALGNRGKTGAQADAQPSANRQASSQMLLDDMLTSHTQDFMNGYSDIQNE